MNANEVIANRAIEILGGEIGFADGHDGALLDIVALLAAIFDELDKLREAFGVEAVGRVEILKRG